MKVKRSKLRKSFRDNPVKAIAVAWLYFLVVLPICSPGIIMYTEGFDEIKKLYEEIIPIMFWQVED